jgi:hypothetical protein
MEAARERVLPDRAALAATLDPPASQDPEVTRRATQRAEQRAGTLLDAPAPSGRSGRRDLLLISAGKAAVREAIDIYRRGGRITSESEIAWLAAVLAVLPIRDDAWAHMVPEHTAAHRRLWTDVVRRASRRYLPAPASLLAFTAWQSGNGALANVALDRALEADPGYSMALLLRELTSSGAPPMTRLPMTPDEVAASYGLPADPPPRHSEGSQPPPRPGSSPAP